MRSHRLKIFMLKNSKNKLIVFYKFYIYITSTMFIIRYECTHMLIISSNNYHPKICNYPYGMTNKNVVNLNTKKISNYIYFDRISKSLSS